MTDDFILEVEAEDDPIVELFIETTETVEVFEDSFGPPGSSGEQGGPRSRRHDNRIRSGGPFQSTDPHPNVVSTTAFDDWLDAMTPDI